jgi:hypothetical protein
MHNPHLFLGISVCLPRRSISLTLCQYNVDLKITPKEIISLPRLLATGYRVPATFSNKSYY